MILILSLSSAVLVMPLLRTELNTTTTFKAAKRLILKTLSNNYKMVTMVAVFWFLVLHSLWKNMQCTVQNLLGALLHKEHFR